MDDNTVNHGFIADTLVLTREGPRPIHSIEVGDLVLSRSPDSGVPAFKRVARLVCAERQAIYRVLWYPIASKREEYLFLGARHRVLVLGHEDPYGSPEDDAGQPTGWLETRWLQYGALLAIATREPARVGMADPVWLSLTEGVGRIDVNRWAEAGSYIDFRDGKRATTESFQAADLTHTGNFLDRYNDADTAEEWAYRCDLYDLEVEGSHNYYVGETGICVHDASPTSTDA